MRTMVGIFAGVVLLAVAAIAGTIAFDSPKPPPPLASVSAPFQAVDFSDLPPLLHDTARDGADLAYRRYAGNPDRVAVLIHGSAGSASSMHAVAKALAAAGATVIVPDVRGHGRSGPQGDIAYIGQLEDDLDDLMSSLERTHRARETTLVGFSSGGGFALRIAGGRLGQRFSRYILLAPYLRHDAPNARVGTGSGGWVSVAVPRIVALLLVNRLGVTAFDGLPVLAFGLPAGNPDHLVPTYSYRLLMNFQPDDDYLGDLRRTARPIMAMDGADDELFLADKLQGALAAGKPGIRVDIVPSVGHIGLTTTPAGTAAIVRAWSSRF
ncbi:alpha/beta hydrolase [Lichenicoccus sp.]|uniref:alpha/beta hydrolase n=1 Tax=Lichenicoccus sp. TaxID=2781899 RepID=UPI003D0990A4